jgi:hypothetical protein
LLLALASAAILRSGSRGTRERIFRIRKVNLAWKKAVRNRELDGTERTVRSNKNLKEYEALGKVFFFSPYERDRREMAVNDHMTSSETE